MLSVDDAVARVCAGFVPLPVEWVPLAAGHGRVLAEDVTSRTSQPPADVSAMDGYAVTAEPSVPLPAMLRIIGESRPGAGFGGTVGSGEAVRILTGAPVPAGAGTIVIQENAERDGDRLTVPAWSAPGRHIRRQGGDFAEGSVALHRGEALSARALGLAAAMNQVWLPVRRRPRLAVLATGDELVMPGEPLRSPAIVNSNSGLIGAVARTLGADVTDLGIARDEGDAFAGLLATAQGADLIVTIGGVSVGDRDPVRLAVERGLIEAAFHKVAMRPGKPLLFGQAGGTPLIGLPGNPVSTMVGFMVFIAPILDALLGAASPAVTARAAYSGADLPANDWRQDYLRASLRTDAAGAPTATPFAVQDSAMLSALAAADCLIVRRPHAPAITAGGGIVVLPLAVARTTT